MGMQNPDAYASRCSAGALDAAHLEVLGTRSSNQIEGTLPREPEQPM